MAWRPSQYLLEGVLDNTVHGCVTGWMKFAGMQSVVRLELKGDFHRDIRGATICFRGDGREDDPTAASYMESFATQQTGRAGDITAGLPPQDYTDHPYIEFYSDDNGRVVIELSAEQVTVLGTLRPWTEMTPISREEQAKNMVGFLDQIAKDFNAPAVAVGSDGVVIAASRPPQQASPRANQPRRASGRH